MRKKPPTSPKPDVKPAGQQIAPADAAALYLISGQLISQTRDWLVKRYGQTPAQADKLIEAAQAEIVKAGEYDKKQKRELAIKQVQDIHRRAITAHDTKTALGAVRELNKLEDLYRNQPTDDSDAGGQLAERNELEKAYAHLAPLKLAPPGTPLHELARLAVQEITRLRSTSDS